MSNATGNIGRAAHLAWEATRGTQNECDAEREAGSQTLEWWRGWLERSDEWREEIGHDD